MRGYHMCRLCRRPYWPPIEVEFDGRHQMLGNGEIRVRGADGTLYAAPSLIAQYVGEHGYLPPVERSVPACSRKRDVPIAEFALVVCLWTCPGLMRR